MHKMWMIKFTLQVPFMIIKTKPALFRELKYFHNFSIAKCNYCRKLFPISYVISIETVNKCGIHSGQHCSASKKDKSETTSLIIRNRLFDEIQNKNKETFAQAIEIFEAQGKQRRGHVEFIYSAMNYLEEFGVHKDLDTYKKLMNVFPKGVFIAKNMWQVEFQHYPRQQQCAIDLLDEMEGNGVLPDREMKDILMVTFGSWSFPMRKFYRMMYWMPKFKHLSPWPLPNPAPLDPLELAKLAISRISSVDLQTKLTIFETKKLDDAMDDTWIVSAQSPIQQKLIEKMSEKTPAYVEGPFQVFIRQHMVNYFMLRTDARQHKNPATTEDVDDVSNIMIWMFQKTSSISIPPSVHEQEEGTILSVCATGSSSHDSLLSWIRFLQDSNPHLAKIPIIFSLRSSFTNTDLVPSKSPEEAKDRMLKAVNDTEDSKS